MKKRQREIEYGGKQRDKKTEIERIEMKVSKTEQKTKINWKKMNEISTQRNNLKIRREKQGEKDGRY